MNPEFKLFGLQRSCTNIVRHLLVQNFHVRSVEEGWEWKHGPVKDIVSAKPKVFLAHCVRDPYAWLVSSYRWYARVACLPGDSRWKQHVNGFERHVSSVAYAGGLLDQRQGYLLDGGRGWPFDPTACQDPLRAGPMARFETPVHRWNIMNCHWIGRVRKRPSYGITVCAESLYEPDGQARLVEETARVFPWRRRDGLVTTDRRIGPKGSKGAARVDIGYFRERRYLTAYSEALLAQVADILDPNLLREFGYRRWTGRVSQDPPVRHKARIRRARDVERGTKPTS